MLEEIEWEACVLEPRRDAALERDMRQQFGIPAPPILAYFECVPWVARGLVALLSFPRLHVNDALSDLIGLVVAEDNSCRCCYAAHRALMRLQGFSSRRVRELEQGRFKTRIDARDVLALEFARRISRAETDLTNDRARLRAVGWADDAINEIAAVAAANVFWNRASTIPALPVAGIERIAAFPGLSLLEPLARRLLFPPRRETTPLEREHCVGPWAFAIEALARLPAGRCLRHIIDEACESPVLPHSSKLLVFAVIARAVNCARSEREAVRLLIEADMAPESVGEVLRHLHSSQLDPTQVAIVEFARESVRYRPSEIQRGAHELRKSLGEGSMVELIGIMALGNALCRLTLGLGATE